MLGAAARDEVTRRYSFDRMVARLRRSLSLATSPAGVPTAPACLRGRPRPCAASPDDSTTIPLRPVDRGRARGDDRRGRASRPRRRRLSSRARHRPRPPPPEHHRPVDRRSAADQRGRHDLDGLQRRDLQLRRGPRRARWRTAIASAPAPTPRSSSTATSSGASAASSSSAACSPSRVWDAPTRRLLLARDRLGVKPLYYAELPGRGIVFGSEIKSLLEDPDVPRDWRPDALDAYLTLLYIPAPATIYKGIHKLQPGHVLVAETRRASERRATGTWSSPATATRAREEEYLEQLDALLARIGRAAPDHRRAARRVPLGRHRLERRSAAYMVETSTRPPRHDLGRLRHARYDELAHAQARRRASRLRVPPDAR